MTNDTGVDMRRWNGTVPLQDVLDTFAPAYPDTWDEVFESMRTSRSDAEVVELLREELRRDGAFREPILASYDDEDEKFFVACGHHRVTATWLEGKQVIRVTSVPYPEEDLAKVLVSTTNQRPHKSDDPREDGEDVFDFLRSMRLDDASQTWVEALTMFGSAGADFEMIYVCPRDLYSELESKMIAVLASLGFSVESLVVSFLDDNDDDDDDDDENLLDAD